MLHMRTLTAVILVLGVAVIALIFCQSDSLLIKFISAVVLAFSMIYLFLVAIGFHRRGHYWRGR